MSEKKILGRGLSAIFEDINEQNDFEKSIVAVEIPVKDISPNPNQPRKFFDEKQMEELTESIKREGVLQPILIKKNNDESNFPKYQIIAGERRWRAAFALNLKNIPAVVLECNERTALQLALIENLQRDGLSPIDEAEAIKSLMEFGKTQEEVALMLSKSRSYVANSLRLLRLPDSIREMIHKKLLTAGHARTLLDSDNPEKVAQEIVEGKLSVREAEQKKRLKEQNGIKLKETDLDLQMVEKSVSEYFGTNVKILPKREGCVLQVYFYDYNKLDSFLEKLIGI